MNSTYLHNGTSAFISHRKIIENHFKSPDLLESIYITDSDHDPNIESIPMKSFKVELSSQAFQNFEETFGSQQEEETDQLHTWEVIGRDEFDFEIELLQI